MKLRTLLKKSPLIIASLASIGYSAVGGLINYVVNVYNNRNLSSSDFGDYVIMMGLLSIVTMPISAALLFMIRAISSSSRRSTAFERAALVFSVFTAIACVTALVMVLFSGWLSKNMQIRSPSGFFLLALTLVFSATTILTTGMLYGLKKANLVTASHTSMVLLRLVLTFVFVLTGFSLNLAILSALIPHVLITVWFAFVLFRYSAPIRMISMISSRARRWFVTNISDLVPLMISQTIVIAVMHIDIFLAKRFFSADDAGMFATASILGKILVFLPSFVGPLLFAQVSSAGKKKHHHLRDTLLLNALVVLGGLIVIIAFARPLIVVQFTERYASVAPLVSTYAIGAACLSFTNLLCNYLSACKTYWPQYLFTVFMGAFYLVVRGAALSVGSFVTVSVVFQGAVLLFAACAFFYAQRISRAHVARGR